MLVINRAFSDKAEIYARRKEGIHLRAKRQKHRKRKTMHDFGSERRRSAHY